MLPPALQLAHYACCMQGEFLATFSTQIGTVCTSKDLQQDVERFSKNGYKKVRCGLAKGLTMQPLLKRVAVRKIARLLVQPA